MNGDNRSDLVGSDYRYMRSSKGWRVDDERRRWIGRWLKLTILFSGIFASIFLLAFIYDPGEVWTIVTFGILGIVCIVSLGVLVQLRMTSTRGVYWRSFSMKPATLDALLHRAISSIGEELMSVPIDNSRWAAKRNWDCYRSYALKGRSTRINVVRKFTMRVDRVEVLSFIDMGPKGTGEDDLLDQLAGAIDAHDHPVAEVLTISFDGMENEYRTKRAIRTVSQVIGWGAIIFYVAYQFDIVPNVEGQSYFTEYPLFLIILIVSVILTSWSSNGILALARRASET